MNNRWFLLGTQIYFVKFFFFYPVKIFSILWKWNYVILVKKKKKHLDGIMFYVKKWK